MTPLMREALHLVAEHPSNSVALDPGEPTRLLGLRLRVNLHTAQALQRRGLVDIVSYDDGAGTDSELVLTETGAEELARQLGDR